MLSTQARLLSGGRILSLALLGGITLSPIPATGNAQAARPAAPAQSWLTLAGPWLCRTWASSPSGDAQDALAEALDQTIAAVAPESVAGSSGGATVHCTSHWHVNSSGQLLSDDPNWVSTPDGLWPTNLQDSRPDAYLMRAYRPAAKSVRTEHHSKRKASVSSSRSTGGSWTPPPPPPGGYDAWAPVPGHPSYGMSDFAGDPWHAYFGFCTWWAWYRHQSEPLLKMGNAANWPRVAPSYGLHVGTKPVVGATAVFQPGVEGADSGAGHVGHVEAVLSGGWFIISEMNFGWNGGGWGRVDWRYVYVASGVSFIY
ncbi:MAG TPA: CHAP domain-containing protein [Ktedonobacterales bacterium]|nr:CHAP domain-containing protein [Ktedonobacterales bacterium]